MHKVHAVTIGALLLLGATFLTFGACTSGQAKQEEKKAVRYLRPIKSRRAFAEQAVFKVKVYDPVHTNSGGTGFLTELKDGSKVIITNRHVCENPSQDVQYLFLEQGSQILVGKVKAKSDDTDLCVIQPPNEVLETRRGYKLGEYLTPGDHVRIYGHPLLLPLVLYEGHYVNESEEPIGMHTLAFDPSHIMLIGRLSISIYPGNSGSPILDDSGRVVGVVFAMDGYAQSGLFIPVSEIKKFVEGVTQ